MGLKRKTHGLSLDPNVLEKAKKRSEELQLSFSAYIHHLIMNDLQKRGPITIGPKAVDSKKDK